MLLEKFERWFASLTVTVRAGDSYWGLEVKDGLSNSQILTVEHAPKRHGAVYALKYATVICVLPSAGSGVPWHLKGKVKLDLRDFQYRVFKGQLVKIQQEQVPAAYKLKNTTTQYRMEK